MDRIMVPFTAAQTSVITIGSKNIAIEQLIHQMETWYNAQTHWKMKDRMKQLIATILMTEVFCFGSSERVYLVRSEMSVRTVDGNDADTED